eukprot:CAMPEP_0194319214 /NCGR_PEP_ID=MMETSP0171-20130528/15689_1 /TAXON_ID=218684 /ORGANISM="Corethron pennatum, Strain L29A3" /LENGTH=60 /DNA_ID=CAMNT_0039076349 /DNA_START=178 /DNA_END=357 /DNA_ORIENTATION=-
MIRSYEAGAPRAKLRTVRRRNSILRLLLALRALSSAAGRAEGTPGRRGPARDRPRGPPGA